MTDIGPNSPPSGSFNEIEVGYLHACAIDASDTVQCWGSNSQGQRTPPAGELFETISAGNNANCGITLDHRVACWGRNDYGQTDAPEPGNISP